MVYGTHTDALPVGRMVPMVVGTAVTVPPIEVVISPLEVPVAVARVLEEAGSVVKMEIIPVSVVSRLLVTEISVEVALVPMEVEVGKSGKVAVEEVDPGRGTKPQGGG